MIFVIEKTTLLIYNPRAGKSIGRPKPKDILERFGADAEKIHIAVTAYPGHAKEIAALEGNRYETVICCGGDGTLNEVISGLSGLESRPVIGYIPMGSTNDLANNIGIPSAISNAAKVIEQGFRYRRIQRSLFYIHRLLRSGCICFLFHAATVKECAGLQRVYAQRLRAAAYPDDESAEAQAYLCGIRRKCAGG